MKRMIDRWRGLDAEERENAAWRPAGSVTFLTVELMWEGGPAFQRDRDPRVVSGVEGRFLQLVGAVVEAQGGVVSTSMGNFLLAVFASPLPAVMAAVEAHRHTLKEPWPEGQPVQGRYALYTGEAETEEQYQQYRGDALGYALWLGKVGESGQIRMGERTARETRDHLPPGITLVDDGEAEIDRFPAEHVYTIRIGE